MAFLGYPKYKKVGQGGVGNSQQNMNYLKYMQGDQYGTGDDYNKYMDFKCPASRPQRAACHRSPLTIRHGHVVIHVSSVESLPMVLSALADGQMAASSSAPSSTVFFRLHKAHSFVLRLIRCTVPWPPLTAHYLCRSATYAVHQPTP